MKSLVLLLAVFLVAGCDSGKFGSPSGSVTATQAASFAQLTGATSPQSSIKFNTASAPNDLPTQGLSRDEETDCDTQDPETVTDADSDGIPLTKKVTWNCTDVETRDRANKYTRQGSVTITDKDDTVAFGGYKYDYDVTGNGTQSSSTYNYEYKGFWEMTKTARNGGEIAARAGEPTRATSWTYNTDFEGTYNYQSSGSAPSSGSYGHTFEYTMSENAATRGEESREESGNGEGTAEFKGYYAYAHTGDGHRDGAVNVVFRVESSGLTWKRSGCTNFYKSGQIKWTDGAGNIMIWEYTGCTTWRVTYNGSTVYEDKTP